MVANLTREVARNGSKESGTEVVITPTFLDKPSDVHPTVEGLMTAQDAYEWIVQHGGASLPARDQVDSYLVEELTSLGRKGGIILTEMDLPTQGPGENKVGDKPLDTDNDGMPDDFEDTYGLDKNDPSDAMKIASNGYTNIRKLHIPDKQMKKDIYLFDLLIRPAVQHFIDCADQ